MVSGIRMAPPTDFIGWADALGLDSAARWLRVSPLSATLVGIALTLALSLAALLVVRRGLLGLVQSFVRRSKTGWDDVVLDKGLLQRLSWAVPWLVADLLVPRIPHVSADSAEGFHRIAACALVYVGVRSLAAALGAVDAIYSTYPMAAYRPIKGYLQILVLLATLVGVVVVISILFDRSPWLLLSGLGAMTAVLLLVFRDTLLSLVAGIRLTTNDLIRVGDWIEMPQFGADGDVVDIALHAVKVQNWDRTFTVIPTHSFLEHSFRNWRGMSESGGRRIKRALHIDLSSIRFIDDSEIERFSRFKLLGAYIAEKKAELETYNREHCDDPSVIANARRLTNLGTLRAYITAYLQQHPHMDHDSTLMVRQLAPTPDGLPLEIYGFSKETAWTKYEAIQADIFDHVLAIVPQFGLRVFQSPSGGDFAALARDAK